MATLNPDTTAAPSMRKVCAWCQRVLAAGTTATELADGSPGVALAPTEPERVTHGICPACERTFREELRLLAVPKRWSQEGNPIKVAV